jgi:hypothetical protein
LLLGKLISILALYYIEMKKSFSLILGLFIVSLVLFSCKTKKTGCDAYGENSSVKKTAEQSR